MIEPMPRLTKSSSPPQDHVESLTPEQARWAEHSESLWRRAHAIALEHPGSDVSDLYHALRCLELTPTERLAAGLRRGRLRTHSR